MTNYRQEILNVPWENYDELSKRIYQDFLPDLSTPASAARAEYIALFNFWEDNRRMPASIYQRKDKRPTGRLAIDLYDNALCEREIMEYWMRDNAVKRFGENASLEYNGIEESGCLVMHAEHDDFKKVDFKINGKWLLELKLVPRPEKATYKKGDLRSYIQQKAAMLTVFSKEKALRGWLPADLEKLDWQETIAFYTFMTTIDMQRLMANENERKYKEMGWKPSYQLAEHPYYPQGHLTDYGRRHYWMNP